MADGTGRPPQSEADRQRCMMELEFVQCLANPKYLQFLAQQRYFNDPAFLNYLKYLDYWRRPEYSKLIVYPYCLEMLANLQHPSFRAAVASENAVQLIHQKEFYHWSHWRKNHPDPMEQDDGPTAEAAGVGVGVGVGVGGGGGGGVGAELAPPIGSSAAGTTVKGESFVKREAAGEGENVKVEPMAL